MKNELLLHLNVALFASNFQRFLSECSVLLPPLNPSAHYPQSPPPSPSPQPFLIDSFSSGNDLISVLL